MNIRISHVLLVACACLHGVVPIAAADELTFSGAGSSSLAPFTVEGPWTLYWTSRTEFPALARIEIRLYDDAGEFLGKVADRQGAGAGHKLFSDPGRYRIDVVASNIEWDITIREVGETDADTIRRQHEGGPSTLDTARRVSSRVPEDSFDGWSTAGDGTLLLFRDGRIRWRVSFARAECPGLDAATAISFVSAGSGSDAGYDSILLDDGTRCYFSAAIPAAVR